MKNELHLSIARALFRDREGRHQWRFLGSCCKKLAVIQLLSLIQDSNGMSSFKNAVMDIIFEYSLLKMIFLVIVILLLLLFLFTSIKLPLTANTVILRPGDFCALLAISILASSFLSPSPFWVTYMFLIIISPCYKMLWSLFQKFVKNFNQCLHSFPEVLINFVTIQNQQNLAPARPPV